MPRPGFYNDNEYRAYPFVFKPGAAPIAGNSTDKPLPESAVVDAGIIMRLDCQFDDSVHSVWLSSVTRDTGRFYFELKTDATSEPLVFVRDYTAAEWQIEYADSAERDNCDNVYDPVWEGFLVTGPLKELNEWLPADDTIRFNKNTYQLEPARIQNLNKTYVRSINVGNYDRINVPECGTNRNPAVSRIVLNKECMAGDIKFKEGYNCVIRQTAFNNEIVIGAAVGAGARADSALCANGSELPLFPGELLPPNSKFFSGGPACDELIFTVNGLGGPAVTLTGGRGINISTRQDPPQIVISRNNIDSAECAQS